MNVPTRPPNPDYTTLLAEHRTLLEENNRLVTENNEILRRMQRNARWAFIFKLVWLAILIGAPVILYFYFIAPLLDSLGGTGSFFNAEIGSQLEQLDTLLEQYQR